MDKIDIRLDGELKHELQVEARERGITPSEVVRELVQEHVKLRATRGSCLDIARRIGLISAAGGGLPPDLSTGRDHFDGFGHG
jgi:hypothetical protein